ncbi:MAG: hypothetical protein ACXAEU_11165 [Candidatus Hodarchaeales archaeon]|jgi:translation initiation factor 6
MSVSIANGTNTSANLEKIKVFSGSNVGVHLVATEDYVLAPENIKLNVLKNIKRCLDAPVYTINANTNLFGVLTLVNKHGLVLSTVIDYESFEVIENLGLGRVARVPKNFHALGNCAVTNDTKTILSPFIDENSRKIIKNTLKTDIKVMKLGGSVIVGSLVGANVNGAVVSDLIPEEDLDRIKEGLGIRKAGYSTVNKGFMMPSTGFITNSKGVVVGEDTSGLEIMKIMNLLFDE